MKGFNFSFFTHLGNREKTQKLRFLVLDMLERNFHQSTRKVELTKYFEIFHYPHRIFMSSEVWKM